jgi:hypothetical protein
MRKVPIVFFVILALNVSAFAQQSRSYVYAFGGPVVVPRSAYTRWDGSFIHVGGGGEGALTNRFGLAGEFGVLKPLTNPYAITTGVASVSPTYHFLETSSKRKLDPFIDGGASLLLGKGSGVTIHYGGGMNYWLKRRFGLRVEFRHQLWSPEAGETVHFLGVRFGVVFRIG